jgi:general secretion pathway protein L
MRRSLFIRLPEEQSAEVDWLPVDATGQPEGAAGRGPLADAAGAVDGRRVVMLVPGAEVLLTRVVIPTRNRQRMLKALPYALEDQLTDEVDILHFAIGRRQSDGAVPVAVIARSHLERWLEAATKAGIRPDVIAPDVLSTPWQPGQWTVLLGNQTCVVRTGDQTGFVADPDALPQLLRLALDEAGENKPDQVKVIACADSKNFLVEDMPETELVPESCPQGPLETLARSFSDRDSINLLQGSYSQREQLGKYWRPWRPAAAMLGALLLVQVTTMTVQNFRLQKESTELAQKIEQIYRNTFPEAKRVPRPKAQMEQQLTALRKSQGGGDRGFLELLARTGDSLKSSAVMEVNGISYRNGQLDVELTIKDLQSLDGLKQRIEQKGLHVDIRSATAREGNVSSRLRITGDVS